MTTQEIIQTAALSRPRLAILDSEKKNRALISMAESLETKASEILEENEKDLRDAAGKYSEVMLDRLALNRNRINNMAEGIRQVAGLPDPVGRVLEERKTSDGLILRKVSVPIGVIAVIYESRPNVTSDVAALCLKSGNVCILRGGKEAYRTSHAILKVLRQGLLQEALPETLINMLEDTTREGANELMRANGYVDLLIPRGGAGLIRACVEQATVPVVETGTGICTVYVDKSADERKALSIILNAKTQRPSVCNAEEQLLVHQEIAERFLPKVKEMLVERQIREGRHPVELRVDFGAARFIQGTPASEEDFHTEFLDYILAVKTVEDTAEAVQHIADHSTHHSDCIVTEDPIEAEYFTSRVDSAAVYVNASTRFTDGGCFGLGCEMGISTQKLHARGPMGLQELTSYKYIVTGDGQVRKG